MQTGCGRHLRHKAAGRTATTSRRPRAQAQNWPIRAQLRHACASAQGRALAAFVAAIPRAASGAGAVPRAARRHHSGGRSAPLGFGVSALFFLRLGLLGNLLKRSGVCLAREARSFCAQQGAVLCRAGAGSPLPRPSRLKKLGSVFTASRCFPSAPAHDPGPYCLLGSLSVDLFCKACAWGQKSLFLPNYLFFSWAAWVPQELLVLFFRMRWSLSFPTSFGLGWACIHRFLRYETPSCQGRRFGRQINVLKGHPNHSAGTPPRPLLVFCANSP